MRVWVGLVFLFVVLALPSAQAMNFTDNQGYGFNLGTHINTTASAAGLTLDNETAQSYYTNGTFMSRTFDAGQVVYWINAIANITYNSSEQSYSFLYAASNNSASWGGWSPLPHMGRYLNYSINLSSTNNQTRPVIDMVNITYSYIAPDVHPASPAAGYTTNVNSAGLNCSATSVNGLKNISIYWNGSAGGWGANATSDLTGFFNYTNITISGLQQGAYAWACLAYDSQHNAAWSQNRTLYYQTITSAPAISPYNISLSTVMNGSSLSLAMYASSSSLSSVWITLSYPNASTIRLSPANGGVVSFTPPVVGTYNVTFFANDTTGNTTNISSSFTAVAPVPVNISVTGRNGASLVSNITFYYAGTSTQAVFYSSDTGSYGVRTAPNTSCDIIANAYSGNLTIWLLGVDIPSNTNKAVVLDNPNATGFIRVYAINSSYSIGSAKIRISYSGINVTSESNLRMQRCADWNFTSSSCSGNWTEVSSITDTSADYLQADISGFSAYALKQGGYCGDLICDSGETPANCLSDCSCTTGATRLCSAAHSGQCAIGTELCTNGAWTGCPLQAAEVCDQVDDNCDGMIDNVNNGTSVSSTSCQCYNSGRPVPEACNGIDDNCNGQIDENIQAQCGTDVGACTFGIKTCLGGFFTNCSGGAEPVPEICGNNIDDDCDGQTDEGCASNVACQFGQIPETGCMCGNMTYAGGYCCFGSFQTEPCVRLPWELLLIFGVMGAVVGVVVHVTRKKNKEASWNELEKKYTPV